MNQFISNLSPLHLRYSTKIHQTSLKQGAKDPNDNHDGFLHSASRLDSVTPFLVSMTPLATFHPHTSKKKKRENPSYSSFISLQTALLCRFRYTSLVGSFMATRSPKSQFTPLTMMATVLPPFSLNSAASPLFCYPLRPLATFYPRPKKN